MGDGLFGFILFIGICILSSMSSKKKKGSSASKTDSKQVQNTPQKPAPAQRPAYQPAAPARPAPSAVPREPTVRTSVQPQRYYDSSCMQADSEHDHNRRLEQLKDFLKDGIIDKEEYNILLAKYQRYR
ncbi:MAG: hypothetical protein Q4A83_08530 [Bacillota bacterium]|nr:hypothetical protein [Bacillota bacterium]